LGRPKPPFSVASLALLFLVFISSQDEGQGQGATFGRSKPPKEQVPMIVVVVYP